MASFCIFLLVQAGNLALETHTFTVPQALSIIIGLIGICQILSLVPQALSIIIGLIGICPPLATRTSTLAQSLARRPGWCGTLESGWRRNWVVDRDSLTHHKACLTRQPN